jgi:uncharacterized protein
MQSHPLTDAELARLEDCVFTIGDRNEAMTPEMMDGFFCALICGPEVVPPSEYMPLIFGVQSMDEIVFRDIEEAQQVFDLLTRHWNTIAATLLQNEVYPALVGEDEDGTVTGREWAWGFQLGMHLREEAWEPLVSDRKLSTALLPIVVLAEDEESGLTLAKKAATPEERGMMLDVLAGSVLIIYNFFRGKLKPIVLKRGKKNVRSRGKKA